MLILKTLLCVSLASLLGLSWSVLYIVFLTPLPLVLVDRLSQLLATR